MPPASLDSSSSGVQVICHRGGVRSVQAFPFPSDSVCRPSTQVRRRPETSLLAASCAVPGAVTLRPIQPDSSPPKSNIRATLSATNFPDVGRRIGNSSYMIYAAQFLPLTNVDGVLFVLQIKCEELRWRFGFAWVKPPLQSIERHVFFLCSRSKNHSREHD